MVATALSKYMNIFHQMIHEVSQMTISNTILQDVHVG